MTAKLHVIRDDPSPEYILRQLIPERDRLVETLARVDRLIAEQGRLYVRERGEFVAPTIERLKRELGA